MIDPLNRAATILDHSPELAEALFDLVTYVAECEDPRNNPTVDRVLEMVYARTEDGTKERQSYRNRRVGRVTTGNKKPKGSAKTNSSNDDDETIQAPIQV